VVVSDVNDRGRPGAVRLVTDAGGEAESIPCDVRDSGQGEALMEGADDRFGGIDVLHDNAAWITGSAYTVDGGSPAWRGSGA